MPYNTVVIPSLGFSYDNVIYTPQNQGAHKYLCLTYADNNKVIKFVSDLWQ